MKAYELPGPLSLPEILAAQELFPKFYCRCKKTGEERAALGSLLTLPTLPPITDPSLCFYGAVSFPRLPLPSSIWTSFPRSFFFLPEIEIRQSHERTFVIKHSAKELTQESIPLTGSCLVQDRIDLPSKETWVRNINSILSSIQKKEVQKVVLARQTSFSTSSTTHLFCWLKKLLLHCPSTETFALQTSPNSLFLGSSPEKLYEKKGNIFSTEAVAGTRKRGSSDLEDQKLQKELLSSIKDQNEFLFVKDFLQKKLSFLCEQNRPYKGPSLIQTEKVQHLYHSFQGVLKEGVTEQDLLITLHPTPAVNGYPTNEALFFNASLEPFDRGLYSGVVGWASQGDTSFTVAIRSALVEKGALHAFAGTGIVEGSDPEKEWIELEHKIAHW